MGLAGGRAGAFQAAIRVGASISSLDQGASVVGAVVSERVEAGRANNEVGSSCATL